MDMIPSKSTYVVLLIALNMHDLTTVTFCGKLKVDAQDTFNHGERRAIWKRRSYAGPVQSGTSKSCCVDKTIQCDADTWKAKCISAVQKKSGNYRKVRVTFNTGRPYYKFDVFDVWLYNEDTTDYGNSKFGLIISSVALADGFCEGAADKFASWEFPDVQPGVYTPRLKPMRGQCECSVQCKASAGPPITVIANPCHSNPCDTNADCHPMEDAYNCTCHHGYIPKDDMCHENPCSVFPCGSNGTCTVDQTQSPVDYRCSCNEGNIEVKKSCYADPCYHNPCGSSGICNVTSEYNPLGLHLDYACTCYKGYYLDGSENKACVIAKNWSEVKAVAAVIGSLLAFVILLTLILSVVWHKRRQEFPCWGKIYVDLPNDLPNDSVSGTSSIDTDQPELPKVLILYPNDSDFCTRIVQETMRLADFLQQHCQCTVWLDIFETTPIDTLECVADRLAKADKVILIFSEESEPTLQASDAQGATSCHHGLPKIDLLVIGYEEMKRSCETEDNSDRKWLGVHMDSTPLSHDDFNLPICVPLFTLPNDIDGLNTFLHDIPGNGLFKLNQPENLQDKFMKCLSQAAPSEYAESSFSEAFEREIGERQHEEKPNSHYDIGTLSSRDNNNDQVHMMSENHVMLDPIIIEIRDLEDHLDYRHVSFVRQEPINSTLHFDISSSSAILSDKDHDIEQIHSLI